MRGSLLFIPLIMLSCRKKDGFENIAVIGHGGMGLEMQNSIYHDNSAEAFHLALSIEGCEGVEMDVQLSKDGNLWLYHDPDLSSETNGSGCLNNKTSVELDDLHYTTIHKESLLPFADIDHEMLEDKKVFLDIRHYNACQEIVVSQSKMIEAIINSGITDIKGVELFVILSNHSWIDGFKQVGFRVLLGTTGSADPVKWFTTYPELDGVVAKNSEISAGQVDMIHSLDKKVFIFEMRSPKGIRQALAKFPDGVITDDIRATLIEKY